MVHVALSLYIFKCTPVILNVPSSNGEVLYLVTNFQSLRRPIVSVLSNVI